MSLEGSLQTVALPEVLHLLADTSKSGELRITGSRTDGRLWFAAGELTGFQSGRCQDAVDALFDLLRMEDGAFLFEAGVDRPEQAVRPRSASDHEEVGRANIRPLLERAEARLVEWSEIVAVVPSLAHGVQLAPVAPPGGVVLDAPQWMLVIAIGEGRAVQEVLDRVGLPEFDGCKALKELVDGGVAVVPTAESAEPDPDEPDPDEPEPDGPDPDELDPVQSAAAAVSATADNDRPGDVAPADAAAVDELTEPEAATPPTPVSAASAGQDASIDALADRGPWPLEELASLDTADWRAEAPAAADQADSNPAAATLAPAPRPDQPNAAGVAPAADDDTTGADADFEGDEPINRGLLLKFLSSVRS